MQLKVNAFHAIRKVVYNVALQVNVQFVQKEPMFLHLIHAKPV